ncbi:MAG: endonuclease [Bacteroidales bacterium]|nr:endonuclease [Bacteroidales bacterium]
MLLIYVLAGPCLFSQEVKEDELLFMFYNVENLFDTSDDSLQGDDEFLPEGSRRWNTARYNRKINSVYKVIAAAGGSKPPAFIALCETENRRVLEDLLNDTYLVKFNYGIIHADSPDSRGIDVCMLFDRDVACLIDYSLLIPPTEPGVSFTSRGILRSRLKVGNDTLVFFINHWPSRRGGVLAGEELRISLAGLLASKCDSILNEPNSRAAIIIAGDFNCEPDENPLSDGQAELVNLAGLLPRNAQLSYRYQGRWEMIDQVIVSRSMLGNETGFSTRSEFFRVFAPEFLFQSDPNYPGKSPWPTYRGYGYSGGFSDHLPLLLLLKRTAHRQPD